MSPREVYLGDRLFASWDGWQVKLRAPREAGIMRFISSPV
jgi:hypothetical protein